MDKKLLTVLHERIKLPLFHVTYDIFIGNTMQELIEHVQLIYPGITFTKLDSSLQGYTYLMKHPIFGNNLLVLISTEENGVSLNRTINHECTHLSWYILDALGIKINVDNHEIQAYLMEELYDKISNLSYSVLNKKENNIESL